MTIEINVQQATNEMRKILAGGGVPMLWGPPGIGKSAGVEHLATQLAVEHGAIGLFEYGDQRENPQDYFGYFDVRMTDKDPTDMGLPDKDEHTNTMVRLAPDWWPHVGRHDLPDHGIIILDEMPSALPSVQTSCYQATQERRIGAYKLKPGWHIAAAGNRMSDGGVTYKMPTPLANRLQHLNVKSDSQYWLNVVCPLIGVEPIIQAFIRFRPDLLNTFEKHIANGRKEMAFATERSWHKLSRIITANEGILDEDGGVMVTAAGTVGEGTAVEFHGFTQLWQSMPDINKVLADPDRAPTEFCAGTTYAVVTALAHRAGPETFASIMRYLARLSPEYTVAGIKTVHSRENGRGIYTTKEFIEWSSKNAHLLHG